jgi:bile acid:Na+ symporter, BASS family
MLFLNITLAMIMLALGLGLSVSDFGEIARKPRAAVAGLFGQLIVLPATAFMLCWSLGLHGPLAVGLVLISACPGGAHSNLFANLAGGDTALSVALTAVSGLAVLTTLPLWVGLGLHAFGGAGAVSLPFGETVLQVLGLLGAPLGVGMAVRAKAPNLAAKLERWVKGIAVALLLVIVVGSVSKNAGNVAGFMVGVGGPVLALNVSTMMIGSMLASTAGLERPQRITIVLEVGVQNSVLAVGLGLGVLGDTAYAVPAIVYSLLVYATAGVFVLAARLTGPQQA